MAIFLENILFSSPKHLLKDVDPNLHLSKMFDLKTGWRRDPKIVFLGSGRNGVFTAAPLFHVLARYYKKFVS